jgi:hypothetical protein
MAVKHTKIFMHVLALRRSKQTTPEQRFAYYRFHAENKFRNDKKKLDAANFQVQRLEHTLLRAAQQQQRPRLRVVLKDQLAATRLEQQKRRRLAVRAALRRPAA